MAAFHREGKQPSWVDLHYRYVKGSQRTLAQEFKIKLDKLSGPVAFEMSMLASFDRTSDLVIWTAGIASISLQGRDQAGQHQIQQSQADKPTGNSPSGDSPFPAASDASSPDCSLRRSDGIE